MTSTAGGALVQGGVLPWLGDRIARDGPPTRKGVDEHARLPRRGTRRGERTLMFSTPGRTQRGP